MSSKQKIAGNIPPQNPQKKKSKIPQRKNSFLPPKIPRFQDFTLKRCLGEGRFGSVSIALEKKTERLFALKQVYFREDFHHEGVVDRKSRESGGKVDHVFPEEKEREKSCCESSSTFPETPLKSAASKFLPRDSRVVCLSDPWSVSVARELTFFRDLEEQKLKKEEGEVKKQKEKENNLLEDEDDRSSYKNCCEDNDFRVSSLFPNNNNCEEYPVWKLIVSLENHFSGKERTKSPSVDEEIVSSEGKEKSRQITSSEEEKQDEISFPEEIEEMLSIEGLTLEGCSSHSSFPISHSSFPISELTTLDNNNNPSHLRGFYVSHDQDDDDQYHHNPMNDCSYFLLYELCDIDLGRVKFDHLYVEDSSTDLSTLRVERGVVRVFLKMLLRAICFLHDVMHYMHRYACYLMLNISTLSLTYCNIIVTLIN